MGFKRSIVPKAQRKAKERRARTLRRKKTEKAARDRVLNEFYGRNVGVSA